MKKCLFILSVLIHYHAIAAPQFIPEVPANNVHYQINSAALCATAKETLAYLNKGKSYDPLVIHDGKVLAIPLSDVKATLVFICKHQAKLNDPLFIQQHFDFIRWYPDVEHAKRMAASKPLLKNLPANRILMTKYYVHTAKASTKPTKATPYAIYALPTDEKNLALEETSTKPNLTRFNYGKQAILAGALDNKQVPILAYVSRDDLESALMQGTVVANFGSNLAPKILNVHRNNNIAYNKNKKPYDQERYWYFKQVAGIKGYGKDAEYKITVNPEATFAADLTQFGLGKLMLMQYPNQFGKITTQAGIFSDTGGAFSDNLYQVDFLVGSRSGREAYHQAVRHLPDYVTAYFMVVKKKYALDG